MPPSPGYLTLVQPWRVGRPRRIADTPIFSLNARRCESATDSGRGGEFVFLECPDWVNVIALTPDRRVVMIEQFRYGTAEVTLEVPGGVMDAGETPAQACARELLEETGYGGDPVRVLGVVSANPAMQTNHVHTGLVLNSRPDGPTAPDEHEEIGVRLVPLAEVPGLIRRGTIHHSFVVAAFAHLWLAGVGGPA